MKTRRILTIAAVCYLLVAGTEVRAQRGGNDDGMGKPRPERLERFRKMRLVETLKLNEEEAVRFFARQSAHEDTQRDLMKERNGALDDIDEIVRGKGNDKDLPKLSDAVRTADEKIFKERQRYQEEAKKSLTTEQFAKFLLFERNFNRQVKDALDEMRQDWRPKDRH